MRVRWGVGVLLAFACTVRDVPLEGKRCSATHPCPSPLVCNPFTLKCSTSKECPYVQREVPCERRTVYLSPTGDDAADGLNPATPRQTLSGFALLPGDVIQLAPGTYSSSFQSVSAGTLDCPITLRGAPGYTSTLTATVQLMASSWRYEDLNVEVRNAVRAFDRSVQSVRDVVLRRLRVRNTGADLGTLTNDIMFVGPSCQDCAVLDSEFDDPLGHALFANSATTGLVIRGNRFTGSQDFSLQINAPGALVEGNDFTGTFQNRVIWLYEQATGDAVIRRNVFHDLASGGNLVLEGPGAVESNTFLRVGAGWQIANGGVFRNNLVSDAPAALSVSAPAGSGYNLFEDVTAPYAGGSAVLSTDKVGAASLDADFIPSADSPAVDAADPALPVPGGGGDRADIGAKERGAPPLEDGRYCIPPG